MNDARRSAPHVARNTGPIIEILRRILPDAGLVLEVASGSGEQSVAFARAFPNLSWQPSDPDPAALASIEGWRETEAVPNLLVPVQLDASSAHWPLTSTHGPLDPTQAILCINMVHISPWCATQGLMRGAGQLLPPGALLYLYGPYRQASVETAPSNEAFDRSLKSRNPDWGLRDLDAVVAEATRHGLALESTAPMPANNLSLVFRRS